MTQSLAYKIIRQRKMRGEKYQAALDRKKTRHNLELAKGAASDFNNESTPDKAIWKGTKHKDFGRNIRFFLWMSIHGGYKIGEHWKHIEDFEDWGICKECEITESMDHVLTQCDAPGQALIWELASKLWKKKAGEEMHPTFGEIMACGAIKKGDAGTTRLYRILLSESAYLIWKLRNERVIGERNGASPQEITNRWTKCINVRLELDCLLTNANKWGKKSLKKSLVLATWRKTLQDEDRHPDDWIGMAGVLVGVG
jgi:ribonuclease HI